MEVDLFEDLLAKAVGLKKVAELADGGLVRDRFLTQVNTNEQSHGVYVLEDLFGRGVA